MNKIEITAIVLVFVSLVPLPISLFYYNQRLFPREREIIITAQQSKFTPNEIVVNKGDVVRLFIKSIDVTHGFHIPKYEIKVVVHPGEPVRVEFVADKAGEFMFKCTVVCSFPSHWLMIGKLVVKLVVT